MARGFRRAAPGAASRLRRQLPAVVSWPRRRPGRLGAEIVLALAVGVVAFVLVAVAGAAARSHLPAVPFGLLLLLAVLAVARFAGILYALPVGVVTIEAFDWYFLPPLRILDGATVFVLALPWPCRSSSAGSRLRSAAAQPGQNRPGACWRTNRRRCGGWPRWSPASPRRVRFSRP